MSSGLLQLLRSTLGVSAVSVDWQQAGLTCLLACWICRRRSASCSSMSAARNDWQDCLSVDMSPTMGKATGLAQSATRSSMVSVHQSLSSQLRWIDLQDQDTSGQKASDTLTLAKGLIVQHTSDCSAACLAKLFSGRSGHQNLARRTGASATGNLLMAFNMAMQTYK